MPSLTGSSETESFIPYQKSMTKLAATSLQPATVYAPAPVDGDEPVAMGWRVAGVA